jgi:hypothetical protein
VLIDQIASEAALADLHGTGNAQQKVKLAREIERRW